MATFGQMLARFQASQKLSQQLGKADLGIAAQEEKQDLESARSDYETAVEEAERQMAKNSRKRGLRKLGGQVLGAGITIATGGAGGALASAALQGGLSYAGASSVKAYDKHIENSLGRGLFYKQARTDLDRDIASTNAFISDAADAMKTANIIGAASSAVTGYGGYDDVMEFGGELTDLMKRIGMGNDALIDGIDFGDDIDSGTDFNISMEGIGMVA